MRLIVDLHHVFDRKLRIALRGRKPLVAQEFLDRAQVRPFFQHVCTKSVSHRVGMKIRRQPFSDRNPFDDSPNTAGCDAAPA